MRAEIYEGEWFDGRETGMAFSQRPEDRGKIMLKGNRLRMKCPGCGDFFNLLTYPQGDKKPEGEASWELTHYPESPTLSPSVYHRFSGCGWHGWLRNGEWVGV